MEELGQVQERFSLALAEQIIFINQKGYRVRGKHWLRCDDCSIGSKNSVHPLGIACDLVITKNNIIITDEKTLNFFHDHWDSLGGAKRIVCDLGHYSFFWKGWY